MLCNTAVVTELGFKSNNPDVALSERKVLSYRDALHRTMREGLRDQDAVVIMGQGVDDHKGIFGSTLGLAEEFGRDRVMDLPLAEEGMTGVAIGAALNGLYPIQTHIRADFSLLAMNQIINLAAKYKYMFGGRFEVPMLIRMIVGRSWGQGAQHSQSLQSLFAHIPGLKVVMPSSSQAILDTYPKVIAEYRGPVISFEHRLMYDLNFHLDPLPNPDRDPFESYTVRQGADVTIVATSIMVLEAMRAAEHLSTVSGIQCEVIDLHCVSNPTWDVVMQSVEKTGRLVVADTSWREYGVCAEVCRVVAERNPACLKNPVVSLAMQPAPCPTAKSLEDLFYPDLRQFVHAVASIVIGDEKHGIALPDMQSMVDVYKRFKGPF
ncbi:MAG: alpha-ketoacid dehydrogenase subunit beta [Nitrospirota bacterium]|nr:alpha-ketoacid dehydrogenase subunit beta [Nitrospirota bacterium]MDH5586116.1 alpha-ketoacid dehydrogenase subunit beta [Nitrospirota bacterium]MDH5774639.1 alpha-ketoacid dehydrogenase subunit beta [Nitrospirota bacterium]